MAWDEVSDKLATYVLEMYAPPNADTTLLNEFEAASLDDVPEHRRQEFEDALDYRLGACVNLRTSTAKVWPL